MKILHICLASFYIDNGSYQENMLPKFHKKAGYDVEIVASLLTFDQNGELSLMGIISPYINEYGILVSRLQYKRGIINRILRRYHGTYDVIKKSRPDVIFIHGCQFLDILKILRYVKENPEVRIFVDNHADLLNSASNWVSLNILHKLIWRMCAQAIVPHVEKFYGVLPARVEFLIDVYRVPAKKVELLPMGADDDLVYQAQKKDNKMEIRERHKIDINDFLIVTGGKIDHNKLQTLLLMKAIKNLNNKNIKLLVFGSVVPEYKSEFKSYLCESVLYVGWLRPDETYCYFAASDLVVFPGLHSVFWEQVVGLGKPCVFKYIEGFTHIDLGGNCMFLYNDSEEEIASLILNIYTNKVQYDLMLKMAQVKEHQLFSYGQIAKRSIGE